MSDDEIDPQVKVLFLREVLKLVNSMLGPINFVIITDEPAGTSVMHNCAGKHLQLMTDALDLEHSVEPDYTSTDSVPVGRPKRKLDS